MELIVLSHFQVHQALSARQKGMDSALISLDLGMSQVYVQITQDGLQMPTGHLLDWQGLEEIAKSTSNCYVVEDGAPRPIQYYSESTGRVFSLYPTTGAPTMLVSGIPMHRIKGTDPHKDTLEKVRSIKPVVGRVLDTATGLGYTAIEAARTAEHVTTIELDPTVLLVCQFNPWSQALFDNPRITQLVGDSFELVAGMETSSFTRVIHDPPVFRLAGELYSGEFYTALYRVMRNQSQLFHYIGDPNSKSGRNITAGVIRRLEQVGFRQVRRVPQAFGVVALK